MTMEIYRGKRLAVERKNVTLPDGSTRERLVVHPGDAVAMLPIREDGCCYLIRQYRYAIGEYIYEVPAGTIDPGETPLETARRELIEETGMQALTFIPRGYIHTTPGFTDERIHLFEAHDLTPADAYHHDEDEVIELVRFPLHEVEAMIADGRINDAKTICLVHRCIRRGE
jgi:ADP-ribose pyrophosphatase